MKKRIIFLTALLLITACAFSACTPFDPEYGTSVKDKVSSKVYRDVKIPEIKSDDEKMPTFFDISLFDEENYSDIYLGKKYEYKITYAGSDFELPSSLDDMHDLGWKMLESSEYNADAQILAGKSVKINFENDYKKQITVLFFNSSKKSTELKKCDIVKLIIPENLYLKSDSVYGQFFVNGVSNESAITDVIEYLGTPSHFYAVSENQYYLDYFISSKDKRSGITVYIDLQSDCVTAIEISMY